jgi:hypothetical protein
MDTIPLEVGSAFVAIAAGGLLILVGYIINNRSRRRAGQEGARGAQGSGSLFHRRRHEIGVVGETTAC